MLPLTNPTPSINISACKVCWVLYFLNTNKASEPEGIPPRFLREFCLFFCISFHFILNSCIYPSWRHALVQPVPKKGDRFNPSNYHPPALASAIVKVFKSLLNSLFINRAESNNLLSYHQYHSHKESFFLILPIPSHPLLRTLENYLPLVVISLRHLSESGIRHCHTDFQLMVLLLPSVSPFLASYPFTLNLLLLMEQPQHSSRFQVVFLRDSFLSPTLFLLFINDFHHTPASNWTDDSTLPKSSFHSQPSYNVVNLDLLCLWLLTGICRVFLSEYT